MNAVSPDAIRAETVTITGHGGDEIEAYRAMPLAAGSRGGIVWIHHMPGYDRETKEFVRRLAVNGYHTVAPNLYSREAPGAEPDDAAAAARAAGGVPDERLVGDGAGAVEHLRSLPGSNGKLGVIGHCSG
ncbi:MAG: dienelactone hydrolase family protein, partial [Mycobacteriaceae bacterium]|nr:dienelactone hydrolase family protein [Mycobacteriaceae bacterium]